MLRSALALLAVASTGCIDYLDPGELGSMRFFGEVRHNIGAPMPLLPPISDRDGNAYVLSGARDLRQVTVYTGQAEGGWSSGCSLHKGDDRGAHGWVGRTSDRAWYWSGDALVEVGGETGSCSFVLDLDPASAASLAFLGVIPSIRDAPSRTTVVGLIKSPNDAVPYWAVVDLGQRRYTQLRRFEPSNAENVAVIGTGALDDVGNGVMLVRYDVGGAPVVEARYIDADGQQTAAAKVTGLEMAKEDDLLGFLATKGAIASGILADGRQVVFDRAGGDARTVNVMTPVGVHAAQGELWLVGENGGTPVIAQLASNGTPGGPQEWRSSNQAAQDLANGVRVVDDRAAPRRNLKWERASSGIGAYPFMSASTPHHYAQDTTLWLVAGASYMTGGEERTQVALAPIGWSYP